MVDPTHARLSIVRQCRLVSVARSSFYYEGTGESPVNLRLLRGIDAQFLETPFYGSRQYGASPCTPNAAQVWAGPGWMSWRTPTTTSHHRATDRP